VTVDNTESISLKTKAKFKMVFDAIRELMEPPEAKLKHKMEYLADR